MLPKFFRHVCAGVRSFAPPRRWREAATARRDASERDTETNASTEKQHEQTQARLASFQRQPSLYQFRRAKAAPGAPAPPMAYAHPRFTRDADAAALSSVTRAASPKSSPPSSPKAAAAPGSPEAPTSPRVRPREANEESALDGALRALRRVVVRRGRRRRRRARRAEAAEGRFARARRRLTNPPDTSFHPRVPSGSGHPPRPRGWCVSQLLTASLELNYTHAGGSRPDGVDGAQPRRRRDRRRDGTAASRRRPSPAPPSRTGTRRSPHILQPAAPPRTTGTRRRRRRRAPSEWPRTESTARRAIRRSRWTSCASRVPETGRHVAAPRFAAPRWMILIVGK